MVQLALTDLSSAGRWENSPVSLSKPTADFQWWFSRTEVFYKKKKKEEKNISSTYEKILAGYCRGVTMEQQLDCWDFKFEKYLEKHLENLRSDLFQAVRICPHQSASFEGKKVGALGRV